MGCQLEALKMRSERPYKLDFSMALAFTSEIMEEPILPWFKIS